MQPPYLCSTTILHKIRNILLSETSLNLCCTTISVLFHLIPNCFIYEAYPVSLEEVRLSLPQMSSIGVL